MFKNVCLKMCVKTYVNICVDTCDNTYIDSKSMEISVDVKQGDLKDGQVNFAYGLWLVRGKYLKNYRNKKSSGKWVIQQDGASCYIA